MAQQHTSSRGWTESSDPVCEKLWEWSPRWETMDHSSYILYTFMRCLKVILVWSPSLGLVNSKSHSWSALNAACAGLLQPGPSASPFVIFPMCCFLIMMMLLLQIFVLSLVLLNEFYAFFWLNLSNVFTISTRLISFVTVLHNFSPNVLTSTSGSYSTADRQSSHHCHQIWRIRLS